MSEFPLPRPSQCRPCWLLAIASISAAHCSEPGTQSAIAPLRTPGWGMPGQLLVRTEPGSGKSVLLAHLNSVDAIGWNRREQSARLSDFAPDTTVYRYLLGADRLERITLKEWEQGDNPICDGTHSCWPARSGSALGRLVIDPGSHVIRQAGSVIQTAGRTVLCAEHSPRGDLVAVLSAEGAYTKLLPFAGGVRVTGNRFHELFSDSTGSRVGKPIKLLPTSKGDDRRSVWSANQRFVIYHDVSFEQVWVVPIAPINH